MVKASSRSSNIYAVQCGKCFKWRVVSTLEEFESIRSTFMEDPFFCDQKPDVTCADPADIEYDSTRTWFIDRPNLPKTPSGFQRKLFPRKDFYRMDAYYIASNGRKLRSINEMASFLEETPEYKGLSISDFSFTTPKVMEDTLPEEVERKNTPSRSKRIKQSGDDGI